MKGMGESLNDLNVHVHVYLLRGPGTCMCLSKVSNTLCWSGHDTHAHTCTCIMLLYDCMYMYMYLKQIHTNVHD